MAIHSVDRTRELRALQYLGIPTTDVLAGTLQAEWVQGNKATVKWLSGVVLEDDEAEEVFNILAGRSE